jgi:hypothetical protein
VVEQPAREPPRSVTSARARAARVIHK